MRGSNKLVLLSHNTRRCSNNSLVLHIASLHSCLYPPLNRPKNLVEPANSVPLDSCTQTSLLPIQRLFVKGLSQGGSGGLLQGYPTVPGLQLAGRSQERVGATMSKGEGGATLEIDQTTSPV